MAAADPQKPRRRVGLWLPMGPAVTPEHAGSSGTVVPSRDLVIVRLGPALGRSPIKPGFELAFLVNTAIGGMES